MSKSTLISTALAAGAAFVAEAVTELVQPQAEHLTSATDYAIEALFALGLALAAVAWCGMRTAGVVTARGATGALIAGAGSAAVAVCAVATIAHGSDALGPLFLLGLLGSVIGPILVAVRSRRARPVGAALAVGLVAAMAVGSGGAAILGLAWFAAATMLRGEPVAPQHAAPAAARA
jgi:hypothetical protein